MLEAMPESPLARREAPEGLMVGLREIRDRGMIDLRLLPDQENLLAALKSVLGVDLPLKPRTSAYWGDVKVLWLSVDQWLILCPHRRVQDILAGLRKAFGSAHAMAVDVSDMRAILRIEGEKSRQVLLKGTSLDLLSGDYRPGTCRRMRYAEIAALLDIVEETVFDIYVFRSYADYAWDYIMATARKGSEIRLLPEP